MSKLALFTIGLPGMSALILFLSAAENLPSLGALALPIMVILLLVLINGLFVAAEFAIIGVRPSHIEQLALGGNKAAQRLLKVLEERPRQDRYIATAQLGITVATIGLAMYGEPAIGRFLEPYLEAWFNMNPTAVSSISYVIALGLLTYLHVVVGEMVPKSLALSDAARVALLLSYPMQAMLTALAYPIRLLNAIGDLLLRLLRIPPAHGQAPLLPPEELEMIVAQSAEGGLINVGEEEMIRNIFDFSDRVVGQVMTPRTKVQAIPLNMPYEQLIQLVVESRHSRFPVYDGDLDHIVGILHLKDLVRQTLKTESSFDLRLILRAAPAVPEDQRVETLLAAFKSQRVHMAVVIDEFGGMSGIVTLEDLVEEVVGEVRDEFDLEKEPYLEIEPGVLEVAGDYLVDYLKEDVYLGSDDELPDVETVGGLVVAQLGRPPKINDEVVYHQEVRMRVLDVDRRAVTRVRIEFPTPEQKEKGQGDTAVSPAAE